MSILNEVLKVKLTDSDLEEIYGKKIDSFRGPGVYSLPDDGLLILIEPSKKKDYFRVSLFKGSRPKERKKDDVFRFLEGAKYLGKL